ncbi:MAG TPA: metal ABC transporter substrate-binding protein [Phycisphaerales bacterium]|nr:metal ABC transporter substrate-binding protein [Phycisphaerales bacterium]
MNAARVFAAPLFVTLLVFMAACSGGAADSAEPITADRPLRIVATIRPLELIARDLVADTPFADRVVVSALMSPDVSPHGFEPTPAQVATLRRADVIVYNGFGLDDWAARDKPKNARIVCFADAAGVDEHDHHHHDHGDHHNCDHGPVDEHFWLDPTLTAAMATALAVEISRALGGGDEITNAMQASLQRFLNEVSSVNSAFMLTLANYQNRRIITHHNVFSRIAEKYGLADPVVLRPLAVVEPTPGDLRAAIETVRAEGIQAIMIEPQFSADAARQIASETGVRLVEVDPLGSRSASWSDLMHSILKAITECFRQ